MIHVDPASIAASPAPAEGAPAHALVERQLAMLTRLAEVGMEIVEAVGRQAAAAAEAGEAAPLHEAGLAYARVARAVRLTLALQTRLLQDRPRMEKAERDAASMRRVVRRSRLEHLAERAIAAEPDLDTYEARGLLAEARERLSEAEDDAELLNRPFAEAVAAICADLGLSPEWTARMVAAAGAGSPPVAQTTGGGSAEGREGGGCAITASRPAPAAPSTTFPGPPPPLPGGGSGEDTFLEWPPPPS